MHSFFQKIFLSASFLLILSIPIFFHGQLSQKLPAPKQVFKADFSKCGQSYDCYSTTLKANLDSNGIKPTLDLLQNLSGSNDMVKSYCHSIAHELGREAYKIYNGDIGKIFREGNTTCWSGFFHGALEKAFSHSSNLVVTANELCTAKNGVLGSFNYYQCLHGLGHGLSVHFDNDIYQALAVCKQLSDDYQRKSCYGGVFMENYVANPATGHFPKYLDSADPIAPCDKVADEFKYNCYQLVSIQILKLDSYNFGAAFKTCEASDTGYLDVCYQSVGRDVSGYYSEDPDKSLAACALGNAEAEKYCVWAVASDSVYAHASEKYVVTTCKKAKNEDKDFCYQAVGSGIALLYSTSDQRQQACSTMETNYISTCEKAAGVT